VIFHPNQGPEPLTQERPYRMDAWKISLADDEARSGNRRAMPPPRVVAVERADPVPDGAPDFLRIFDIH
jgi:hypothetical protein